jgi:predicted ATPase
VAWNPAQGPKEPVSGVRAAYNALVAAGELKPDPAQAAVADKLETLGMARRLQDKKDRRVTMMAITQHGAAALKRAREAASIPTQTPTHENTQPHARIHA